MNNIADKVLAKELDVFRGENWTARGKCQAR